MSMIDPYVAARAERSRRRAIQLLSLLLLLGVGFCGYLVIAMLSPRGQSRSLGTINQYEVGKTFQRAVKKLTISDTLQNRPAVSDDPLYITRRADGSWRAILGWDSQSGCIVDPQDDTFVDSCSGNIYDRDGYLISENRRLRLGSLRVEIEGDQVIVRDELLRDELRN